MRKIIIECGGGLGNRLGGLVSGLSIAETLGLKPVINWRRHNTCDCEFESLFDADYNIQKQYAGDILNNINKYCIVSHISPFMHVPKENIINHPKKMSMSIIKNESKDVFYIHNKIPKYLNLEHCLQQLQKLKINSTILDSVNEFLDDNKIDETVIGIHIRKTDGPPINEQKYYDYIKQNPKQRFFVCSDSKSIEDKFSKNKNVIIKTKNAYVEKLIDGSWRQEMECIDNKKTRYNVNRTSESVIQGFEDMLVLSYTNIINNSKSSFLKFAMYYNSIRK